MAWLSRFFWALLALLVFCLAGLAVNQEPISLKFVTWQTPQLSVFWWLLAAFSTGVLLGLVGISVVRARLGLKNRSLVKRLEASERELRRLRSVSYHE
ncbi:MAG TPA: LapA family protein [Pseudomonadales bacterium]|jgi:uncharacterized integral membrane protein